MSKLLVETSEIEVICKAISEGKKITFCKDCKYWSTKYCCLHPHMAVSRDAEDFCSRGEI